VNVYWSDGCPLYSLTVLAQGGQQAIWDSNSNNKTTVAFDAPASILSSVYNVVTRNDSFVDYFMYRPTGAKSIWVTIGKLTWLWGGTATRNGNPNTNGGWTGPTGATQPIPAPTGNVSHEFPGWPQTFLPQGSLCVVPPAK